jgi:hypothetical protein
MDRNRDTNGQRHRWTGAVTQRDRERTQTDTDRDTDTEIDNYNGQPTKKLER